MTQQISASGDAELCKQVLAFHALVYRPITLEELVALAESLIADKTHLRQIIGFCGSFLIPREDTVYFVHQSAKDFLFAEASGDIFPRGTKEVHRVTFLKSLVILSSTLHRDMYGLKALGSAVEDVEPHEPDPLAASRYPCIYWIDRLHESKPSSLASSGSDSEVVGVVAEFLKNKFLHWLEGLSLCKCLETGVISRAKLWSLVQV
jgi:hypothetical protein